MHAAGQLLSRRGDCNKDGFFGDDSDRESDGQPNQTREKRTRYLTRPKPTGNSRGILGWGFWGVVDPELC
jgi:hypothetical protein